MKILICLMSFVGMLYSATAMSCESNTFDIYYLPIEAEFYVPPTREYIIRYGTHLETDSCTMDIIFKEVSKQKGLDLQEGDFKRLRVMIVDKKDNRELFITAEKKVILRDKNYIVDIKVVDDAINVIVALVNAKKSKRLGVKPSKII